MRTLRNINSISVIIATYRRKSFLLDVLNCLVRQTVQPNEVFIVDASPLGEQLTPDILSKYPSWLKYEIYGGREGNASAQRNQAINQANGDLIIFLDDDVDFSEELIESYLRAFQETGADGISGRISIPGKNLDPKKPITHFAILVHNPGAPNYIVCDFITETYVICTANFAIYRDSLLDVGGFDEQLRGTIDDVELGLRLVKAGYLVLHHPTPHVTHFMAINSGARSLGNKFEWALTNAFYFNYKHFSERNRKYLLLTTFMSYCRPSRVWLNPGQLINRIESILIAYREAHIRYLQGPCLLDTVSENG